MSELNNKTRLRWQCRRGMLELDVILSPFLEQHFDSISESEQRIFQALLAESDPDIYTWLMGFGACDKPELASIVQLIRHKMKIDS
ncbi:succinate dehydrogenase assembly factor 2 [Aliikangiella marina]|uniref:FAD assembly factor SdhE n=1 Tax=Aliikangiella marina TaxID=1712262 RepID=A0A545T6L8_9GAMM|nr:succinate dehydrogenase assembly factor 2 [Aliikangiella marina]TQV72828.1 succinate dehydrogenase assembly factor 2 [Aliikangiella marina]